MNKIAIVMGSSSDEAVVKKCGDILTQFNVGFDTFTMSAHRTPNKVAQFSRSAQGKGYKIIIAVAGLAAALPGTIAAHTTLPVIGLPVETGALRGVDALYAMAQMPPGIPVATVGIGISANAAYLALAVLALADKKIDTKLKKFRASLGDA